MSEEFLLCVRWGEQSVDSVSKICSQCGCEVAIDRKNEAMSATMKPICIPCAGKVEEWEFGGSLVGGRKIDDFREALRAALRRKAEYESRN